MTPGDAIGILLIYLAKRRRQIDDTPSILSPC
jgi:hypothetical protein